jgi:hypothetical protein
MPVRSQAQNRFMHAAAEGKIPGVAKSVGQDFVDASAGMKVGALPERTKPKKPKARLAMSPATMGRISPKAMGKMMRGK